MASTHHAVLAFLLTLLISIAYLTLSDQTGVANAVLYKEPTCGCCGEYVRYLADNRLAVNVINAPSLDSIKQERQIPSDMTSCHTMILGRYFVEGHVPLAAIRKLLAEQPDIDGIALPGMPPGSPGMTGIKQGEFIIYALNDGVSSEFMRV